MPTRRLEDKEAADGLKFQVQLDGNALRAIAVALAAELPRPTRTSALDDDQLLDAAAAGVPATTWRRAIRTGELRGFMLGRGYFARRGDVRAWLETCSVSPTHASTGTGGSQGGVPADDEFDADEEINALLQEGRLRVISGGDD